MHSFNGGGSIAHTPRGTRRVAPAQPTPTVLQQGLPRLEVNGGVQGGMEGGSLPPSAKLAAVFFFLS